MYDLRDGIELTETELDEQAAIAEFEAEVN